MNEVTVHPEVTWACEAVCVKQCQGNLAAASERKRKASKQRPGFPHVAATPD